MQARYRRAVYKRYVSLLQEKGMTSEAAEVYAKKKFSSMDVDHKIDLQVSGALDDPNSFSNLGMEDSTVNRSVGKQLDLEIQRLGLESGDTIDKVNVVGAPPSNE